MDPPQLDNTTEFVVHPQPLLDKDGERLVVVVKATLELTGDGELEVAPKERRRGVRMADIAWGDPEKSSILYPADLCLRKPGTDVIVVAKAHAPDGRPAPSFDVAVQVGRLCKLLRVFGPRVWQKGGEGLSAPGPIEEIEVRYDFAWGGFDMSDPTQIVEEPRNQVGLGVARDPDALTHRPAPSIEDPAVLILTARTRPPPAGIGAIGRNWEPRRQHVGTYDERWLAERAPLPPLDHDDRMNLCATPDLIAIPPLVGGEEVALLNLVPGGGATTFRLPRIGVEIGFHVRDRPFEVVRPSLDTVLIDTLPKAAPADGPAAAGGEARAALPLVTVEYVWRAAVKAPRRGKDARVAVREIVMERERGAEERRPGAAQR
jgi:hypothetical protein